MSTQKMPKFAAVKQIHSKINQVKIHVFCDHFDYKTVKFGSE